MVIPEVFVCLSLSLLPFFFKLFVGRLILLEFCRLDHSIGEALVTNFEFCGKNHCGICFKLWWSLVRWSCQPFQRHCRDPGFDISFWFFGFIGNVTQKSFCTLWQQCCSQQHPGLWRARCNLAMTMRAIGWFLSSIWGTESTGGKWQHTLALMAMRQLKSEQHGSTWHGERWGPF